MHTLPPAPPTASGPVALGSSVPASALPGGEPAGLHPGVAPVPGNAEVLPNEVRLKSGLVIHDHGNDSFILEDSERGRFFKLGSAEACFILSLIESSVVQQARSAAANCRSKTLSDDETRGVLNWLAYQELIDAPPRPIPPKHPLLGLFAAVYYWKLPLGNPDAWLRQLEPWLGWLFSPLAMFGGNAFFAIMLLATLEDLPQLLSLYEDFSSSWRWLWAFVAWLVLKMIHELGHAMTSRRYGGEVREAGIALILFMPLAYVNVNSIWRLPSRWQRLHVSLAGVGIELTISALALLVWHATTSVGIRTMCADIMVLTIVNSLLFNLNPLMKFDGYFVLVDLTRVDNLFSLGQSCVSHLFQRYILGLHHAMPVLPVEHRWWIPAYGIAAAMYRTSTMFGLIVVASYMFEGLGLVLGLAGVLMFIVAPLVAVAKQLWSCHRAGELRPVRLAVRFVLIAGAAVAMGALVPSTVDSTLPGIVEYNPPISIRSAAGGFIKDLPVPAGSPVAAGQVIAQLRNADLELAYARLKNEVTLTEQMLLSARFRAESGDYAVAIFELRSLRQQLQEKESLIEELTLRSPSAGVLVARGLDASLETYLPPGKELAVIGVESRKRIRVSVDQFQTSRSRDWIHQPVRIIGPQGTSLQAIADRIEPRATHVPFDNALLATFGGPLPSLTTESGELELCEPRSEAIVPLEASQSEVLRVGQRVSVRIQQKYPSLLNQAWNTVCEALTRVFM